MASQPNKEMIQVDKHIHRALKQAALDYETTLGRLVGQAVEYYLKALRAETKARKQNETA